MLLKYMYVYDYKVSPKSMISLAGYIKRRETVAQTPKVAFIDAYWNVFAVLRMRARCVREALSNSFPLASSSLSDAERPHRDAAGRIYVRNHYSTAELRRCINSMLNNSPQPFTLFILVPVPTAVDRQSLLLDVLIATVTSEMSNLTLVFHVVCFAIQCVVYQLYS